LVEFVGDVDQHFDQKRHRIARGDNGRPSRDAGNR
jgi:hypothetical protein